MQRIGKTSPFLFRNIYMPLNETNKMKGDLPMFMGILVLIGGIILAKYGVAAIIAGLGTIAIGLGIKGASK